MKLIILLVFVIKYKIKLFTQLKNSMAYLLNTILSTLFPQYKLSTADINLPVSLFSFDEEDFSEDDFSADDLKEKDDDDEDDLWFPGDDENGDDDLGFGNDEDYNY